MRNLYRFIKIFTLVFYIAVCYQLWHLCQYGGLRAHAPWLFLAGAGTFAGFVLCLFLRRKIPKDCGKKNYFFAPELAVVFLAAVYFGGRIVYSALPYHGALSWKVEEWRNRKTVVLDHNNFFADGAEGVLGDLDEALGFPEKLYIANQFQIDFDHSGNITSLYAFLYGKDEKGEDRTWLVDYDGGRDRKMQVWINRNAEETYEEGNLLSPMLEILERADCEAQVQAWYQTYGEQDYQILYLGKRSFQSADGLQYLPGDADGDGQESGSGGIRQILAGGEISGYEVSLHMTDQSITPVRYIMEPEYTSSSTLAQEQQEESIGHAKEAESWIVDDSDGSMYFFLNESAGWRLVVADAAAGSRFYRMEKTEDGGNTWKVSSRDPFQGTIGVAEGIRFFDENFGIIGLTGASQTRSDLYLTRDGGKSFRKLEFPVDDTWEIPDRGKEYGYTPEDYLYFCIPEKTGDVLTVKAVTQAGETEGLVFQSQDRGETWSYAGIFSDEP